MCVCVFEDVGGILGKSDVMSFFFYVKWTDARFILKE